MAIHKIIPKDKLNNKEIISMQEEGEIIRLADGIYQVKIYDEPERKIFTTSLDTALEILYDKILR